MEEDAKKQREEARRRALRHREELSAGAGYCSLSDASLPRLRDPFELTSLSFTDSPIEGERRRREECWGEGKEPRRVQYSRSQCVVASSLLSSLAGSAKVLKEVKLHSQGHDALSKIGYLFEMRWAASGPRKQKDRGGEGDQR